MDPVTQNLAQFLTAIRTPTRPSGLADGTERVLQVRELEGTSNLPVPCPVHLAFFTLFPIWEKVKNRISVAANDPTLKATGCRVELGAVAPGAGKRYLACLPGWNPN
jgi:hypothetical protein